MLASEWLFSQKIWELIFRDFGFWIFERVPHNDNDGEIRSWNSCKAWKFKMKREWMWSLRMSWVSKSTSLWQWGGNNILRKCRNFIVAKKAAVLWINFKWRNFFFPSLTDSPTPHNCRWVVSSSFSGFKICQVHGAHKFCMSFWGQTEKDGGKKVE